MNTRILILGSNGQIGTVLAESLRTKYGRDQVICSDIREPKLQADGPFRLIDVLDSKAIEQVIQEENINQVYHLAALLSARGEQNPSLTWQINMQGLLNVLDICSRLKVSRLFFPSSIAVYGPTTPKQLTPQFTSLQPSTVYGISKLAGEMWCEYYHHRYGLDVRSLRYPGVIGWQSLPEGGTTDYAVEIFHGALKSGHYKCFLKAGTRLPMIYMDDAIRATIELMEAPSDKIRIRTGYNLVGMSFTPAEIAEEIKKLVDGFTISYEPDFRQQIAESWSESIDDSSARADWGWSPRYDLKEMCREMLEKLSGKLA
ncbi:MAG: NAD-dependent epimerase/dehydratase family protein [Saprospiraceae bacterium]|nr:NAD-dependent epimerase/dehydratase family protein [Saprospiraceae bacterium]HMW38932.1 NAD-dependent epimerase/dehydratase family protein [Saprospiraceae bacterium]HMX88112.1 NAD-dependent epimerase/dehydratase family protein [Saprospiraceae bacterium]HMZ38921.1 NAD-dependent epimerase/dehydratase family protein [Saprospiraceae bacterium]HNA64682.1 NAD-dependent epimerase/dehydratase family protein [Saprospiraceae bacterium]